ncbi:MAG: riboflavin synthase [candidate division WOR-3 bacterium]|nr:riboflavin synthase [candidate division WOR-3 bacterium]MDW7987581.1 riboflavin synthase [candidate division WOR-3 bacterium]
MFTGIVETLGEVTRIQNSSGNKIFTIKSQFTKELRPKDSVAINGCCLTVISADEQEFTVQATSATLEATNLRFLKIADYVNLERALKISGRFDGHIVLGHIDEVARIARITPKTGYYEIKITGINNYELLTDKGAVAIDGISLTVAKLLGDGFIVNIIPFTYEHTNLKFRRPGDFVNIEYDIIGKYVKELIRNK